MPFPSPTNLAQITGAIWDEFVHLYAQLEGYLRRQHNEDGSHGAITAESLEATGDVTIDGNLTASGTTHALGDVDVTQASGGSQITLDDSWRIQRGVASSPLTDTWALEVLDLNRNTSLPVIELGYYSPSTAYVLIPRQTGLALGFKDGSSVDRIKYLAVQDGVYEQGRTAAAGYWTAFTPTMTSGLTAIGNGTLLGRYTLIGKTLHFWARLVVGSTTVLSGAALRISVPVTMDIGTFLPHVWVRIYDASTGGQYMTPAWLTTSTSFGGTVIGGSEVSNTNPITAATDDQYVWAGTVEIA